MYPGERFNSITHLIGTVLALIGTSVIVTVAVMKSEGNATRAIVALVVYGLMLTLAYLSSTLYHSLRAPKAKKVFHVFDHCAIYLLIAGTYTPFTLVTLRGSVGWTLFAIIWALAIAGLMKDVFLHNRLRPVSVILYVVMGWLVIVAFEPLSRALPAAGVAWLIAGGLVYTGGLAFFAFSKKVRYMHGIWHLFVMGGSVCHYVVVFRYVALTA